MTQKRKPRKERLDANTTAFRVMQEATGERPKERPPVEAPVKKTPTRKRPT